MWSLFQVKQESLMHTMEQGGDDRTLAWRKVQEKDHGVVLDRSCWMVDRVEKKMSQPVKTDLLDRRCSMVDPAGTNRLSILSYSLLGLPYFTLNTLLRLLPRGSIFYSLYFLSAFLKNPKLVFLIPLNPLRFCFWFLIQSCSSLFDLQLLKFLLISGFLTSSGFVFLMSSK